MKKLFFALTMMLTTTMGASAMSYEQARNEALFLTDKMAYELNLSDAQYEAAYEINLDYLMSISGYDDVNGIWWERRNQDLRYILYSWQWDAFCAASYFFRPLYWQGGYWHFGVYARYPRRDYFYFGTPHFYASYRGGHSWRANGGRSFYEHRRDHFRPGHVERSHHVGMRNGWDRGDHRGLPHGNSSTRITAGGHNGRVTAGNRNGERSLHISSGANGNRGGTRQGMGSRPDNGRTQQGMGSRHTGTNTREGFGNHPVGGALNNSGIRTTTTTTSRSQTRNHFGGEHSTSTTTTVRERNTSIDFGGGRSSSRGSGSGNIGGGRSSSGSSTRSFGGSHSSGREGSSRR